MKRYVCILTLVILLAPVAGPAGEIDRIREKGVITVSLNRDYPPFSMQKDGTPIGLDVDLAHLLAEILEVKVKFIRPETYDRQIPMLLADRRTGPNVRLR